MTEYCRLCAELKDPGEIVTSIDDVEESMEQKLRACCQWTTENTEQQLPHSVCEICLDELDGCWRFLQNVQLAQQWLLEIFEIETKSLDAEILPTLNVSSEYSNSFPSTSTAQSNNFNQQSLRNRCKQKPEHKCEICSQEFSTVDELNAHRQQGCEGLIVIESNIADCKPTAVDFIKSECGIEIGEHRTIDDDNCSGSNVIHEQSTNSKIVAIRPEEKKQTSNRNKSSENKNEINETGQQSDGKASSERYTCEMCDKTCSSLSHLKQHRALHTRGPFKCQLCNKLLPQNSSLKLHLISHVNNSNGALRIEECNNGVQIIQTNGGDSIYLCRKISKCEECNAIFRRASELKRHQSNHSCKQTGRQKKEKQQFRCRLCNKLFTRSLELKFHLITHVRRSNGGLKIEETNNEVRIIQTNGGDPIHIRGKVNVFKCRECDCIFALEYKLKEHYSMHHSDECPFECWLCHKTFKTHRTIRAHIKIHIPDAIKRNSICELCGKAFVGGVALSVHKQMIHSNERPFKCETCGFGFKTKSHLNTHRLTHTELQFKCDRCEKSFTNKHNLKQHMKTHSKTYAFPFVCDFCGKGFQTNCNLKDHRSSHTGEKRFKCEQCSSNFGVRSSFYSHMRKVHGISFLARRKEKMTK